MPLPSLFDVCVPREDVRKGLLTESDFAADLAQVLRGDAPDEYKDPVRFFANTHPTRGLKNLLWNVCQRLGGEGGQSASIFRLDTNYGGGKTHALIALTHAAKGMPGVPDKNEFVDPALLPKADVRIAAFDGENADPANGRSLGDGIRAFTPWGEIAYSLAGRKGYERVRKSDETGAAPGAETIKELFGNMPTLVLIDELSVYLRKLAAKKDRARAGGQLTAFLTGLFKAVESSPKAALVYTLAIGKDRESMDAYGEENQFIADCMEEAESVSARKATLLDPTEEDETVRILRRRLFTEIDDSRAAEIITEYRRLWDLHKENLPSFGAGDAREDAFKAGYPLHPELIETFKEKTSTLVNFQRVRGMLRILARTVAVLWEKKPTDAFAVHLHHIDPASPHIRQEIVTKLGQKGFVPALKSDIAAVEGDQPSLAQELDASQYAGLAPFGSYVARAILFHTLAFNDSLKGLTPKEMRYSVLSPGMDVGFIDDAVRRFVGESAYLDDRADAPLRFSTEANLTHMVRRQERQVDAGDVRDQLNDRIRSIFGGNAFQNVPFPNMPNDIPDDAGDGKPYLAIMGYDAVEVSGDAVAVPELVRKLYRERGASGDLRRNRNHLVFLAVDTNKKPEMRKKMVRRLALEALRDPERQKDLSDHQLDRLNEWYRRSEQELAVAIQQAYRHVFYPSKNRVPGADDDLGHTAMDMPNTSANPGAGQSQVVRVLRDMNELRLPEDDPDNPMFIRERTPLKKGRITTGQLRDEYRRDPALPMLVGDDVFFKGVRGGIEQGEFVYQSGELLWGKGDPLRGDQDRRAVLCADGKLRQRKQYLAPACRTGTRTDHGYGNRRGWWRGRGNARNQRRRTGNDYARRRRNPDAGGLRENSQRRRHPEGSPHPAVGKSQGGEIQKGRHAGAENLRPRRRVQAPRADQHHSQKLQEGQNRRRLRNLRRKRTFHRIQRHGAGRAARQGFPGPSAAGGQGKERHLGIFRGFLRRSRFGRRRTGEADG